MLLNRIKVRKRPCTEIKKTSSVEIIVLIRAAKPTIEEVKLSVSKRRDYVITVAQSNKVHYRVSQ